MKNTMKIALVKNSVECCPHPIEMDRYDLLATELETRGIQMEEESWDDTQADWTQYEMVVPVCVWGYHLRPAEFREWLTRMDRMGINIWNPVDTLRWNMSKFYLEELMNRGIDIPDTVFLRPEDSAVSLEEVMTSKNWPMAVIKPGVGANSKDITLCSIGECSRHQEGLEALQKDHGALIQEYIPSITSKGETSVICFDGNCSHAVLKIPLPGNFCVGPVWAAFQPITSHISSDVIRFAEKTVQSLASVPLYARVDIMEKDDGQLVVGEVEMIEPCMFLASHEDAPRRFVDAIMKRIGLPLRSPEVKI